MRYPKVKSNKPPLKERYPLGEFPSEVITSIGRQIIHRLATGMADITGDDFGKIFAAAVDGQHAGKPEGVADVSWNGCAWSVKTVQNKAPHKAKKVRLISGRNSPEYSYNMGNVLRNPQKTGERVLRIWNKRVGQARREHDNLRVVVLLRSMVTLDFCLFEEEVNAFTPNNYRWEKNESSNLTGKDIARDNHVFTWQRSGGQFTIIRRVPASAVHFNLRRPPITSESSFLKKIGYTPEWVRIIPRAVKSPLLRGE